TPMIRFILAITVCLILTSCGKSGAPTNISVTAQGVRLTSFKIEAGKVSEADLRQGLQAAADALQRVPKAAALIDRVHGVPGSDPFLDPGAEAGAGKLLGRLDGALLALDGHDDVVQ